MEKGRVRWPVKALDYKSRQTQFLKLFNDDTKIELLFIIQKHEKDFHWNISKYLYSLRKSPQSDSRMNLFVRELLEIGALESCSEFKATSKHLLLSSVLRSELRKFLLIWAGKDLETVTDEEAAALLFAFKVGVDDR